MSNNEYHKLKIKNLMSLTNDCVGIELDIPESLKNLFSFRSGQYLTLRHEINGEKLARSYSLYSSPSENSWRVAVKRVQNGRFSNYANDHLKVGDQIEVMPPQGNFVNELDASKEKLYVFFTAGSGITPILSHIKDIIDNEPKSRLMVFYGNQKVDSIIFKESLEDLKDEHIDRLSVFHFLTKELPSAPLFSGRITPEKVDQLGKIFFSYSDISEVFLCGPGPMILSLKDHLISNGISSERVHYELFSTDGIVRKSAAEKLTKVDREKSSRIKIQLDGDQFEFDLDYGGKSVLDAALDHGADLPFACKGGVCCTCRALVKDGEVAMDVNYALEPDELDKGFVLTCQSHPRSEFVFIDFDTK